MINKKISILGILFCAIFLLGLSAVSATNPTVSLIDPADSSSITGTTGLNATVTNPAGNFTCLFYAKSSSTANSTWTLLATQSNNSDVDANTTFETTILEDSNDYIFNVSCYNDTYTFEDTNTNIIVDNTVPQTPSSLTPITNTLITSSTSQTFSATVTDVNTSICTYVIRRNKANSGSDYLTGTATHSGGTCSFSKDFTSTADNGLWSWYITASDGTNTSSSSELDLQVTLPGAGGGYLPGYDNGLISGSTSGNNLIYLIIGLVIIGIIAWLYFKEK